MIWKCPECKDGVEGPRAPDAEDPCQLCASCTLVLGRFVRRKPTGRTTKRGKENPRLQHTWQGTDLHAELHRLAEFCPEHVRARPPSLVIRRVPIAPRTVGWAKYATNQLELILWPLCHPGWALGGLVHELAHFAVPKAKHGDDLFRMTMIELVRDGFGVEPAMPAGRRIAQLDHSIEDALVAWVESRKERR